MHIGRTIVMFAAAAGLSIGLSQAAAHADTAAPASAAAATTAQASGHTLSTLSPVTRGGSLAPASGLVSGITFRDCSGSHINNWVTMILYEPVGGTTVKWCFGYTGTWTFSGLFYISNFCSGNNYGSFSYTEKGATKSFSFGPGYRVNLSNIIRRPVRLTITGWRGSYNC